MRKFLLMCFALISVVMYCNSNKVTGSTKSSLNRVAKSVKSSSSDKFVTHVTLTTYNAVASQCDSDPLITADGTKIDMRKLKNGKIRYVAISRDLLWAIPMGSRIHIEGHGEYVVRDKMNKRFNHCIDILQHHSESNFKKHNIKITLIKKA